MPTQFPPYIVQVVDCFSTLLLSKMCVLPLYRMIGLPTGIIVFILAKREVDKNRLKQLKVRQRMKRSNEGEYEGSRYRHHAEDVKLDQ